MITESSLKRLCDNEERFRSGGQTWSSYITNCLKIYQNIPKGCVDFQSWAKIAENAFKDLDPWEISAAMNWAFTESDYWSGFTFLDTRGKQGMDWFVLHWPNIASGYYAFMRQKEVQDRKISLKIYSSACLALMEKYPDTPRATIAQLETKAREEEAMKPLAAECKKCLGTNKVKSDRPSSKGAVLDCPDCRRNREEVFQRIFREVHKELYAPA